ncbi:MAG: radical SAM protein [Pseudomonadota bacterium]
MADMFTRQLDNCRCCPRRCGVNRLEGDAGFCRIPAGIQVAHAGLHYGEEPVISGTRGSGTVFFAGCNLRCVFCQNYQISQEFRKDSGWTMSCDELASCMINLQDQGAHNINFVSPSHMIFQMADAIVAARKKGLAVPIVYNSNGYDSVESLRSIRGLVDIFLPDLKYMDNRLGRQYSWVDDYADVVPGVLREMLDQVGHLETDDNGIALRGLVVRHLVLPGHQDNSRQCLDFLADLSRYTCVSIMSQYSPRHKAFRHPAINRTVAQNEYDAIVDHALDLGLENAFVQEVVSQDLYLPDFDRDTPFDVT